MAPRWIEKVAGPIEHKKRYRRYKARTKALPAPYRTALDALDRYLVYRGAITDGEILLTMLDDLADLFEQSAADATPICDVVGQDPVEFAEAFLANYSDGQWITKEQARLTDAIERVAAPGRSAR